jgi:hypothetical protein
MTIQEALKLIRNEIEFTCSRTANAEIAREQYTDGIDRLMTAMGMVERYVMASTETERPGGIATQVMSNLKRIERKEVIYA